MAQAARHAADGIAPDARAGVAEATEVIADAIRGRAPVDSGRLKGSIRAEVKGEEGSVRVEATRSSRRYKDYPYPVRVELQSPFADPAVRGVTEKALDRVEDKVGDGLERRWIGGA